MLKAVEIYVPEELVKYADVVDEQAMLKRNAMLIYPYIQNGTISYGKAAETLSVSKLQLITLYGEMGIAYIHESVEELEEDLENIKSVRGDFAC